MDNIFILLIVGFVVGTLGTLIGAGGGFILIPILLIAHPQLTPDMITAISMAIVAANAVSGSIAYARSGRIDYKAGILFALFTIPGSILGVFSSAYIPKTLFHVVFGVLLIVLSIFLFVSKKITPETNNTPVPVRRGQVSRTLTDSAGIQYNYRYQPYIGILISIIVGYLSPLLGIGGGIIHVPALINWLDFPVHIATATSHFILAVMSLVSVVTHFFQGNYDDALVQRLVFFLGVGAIAGAQLGAFFSHRIRGNGIIRGLAICLAIVGIRILTST